MCRIFLNLSDLEIAHADSEWCGDFQKFEGMGDGMSEGWTFFGSLNSVQICFSSSSLSYKSLRHGGVGVDKTSATVEA